MISYSICLWFILPSPSVLLQMTKFHSSLWLRSILLCLSSLSIFYIQFKNTVSSYCLVPFYSNLQDSLERFLWGMCSDNGLLHLLFIWKCLNFLTYFWRTALPHLGLLVDIFFLLALWLYPPSAFYPPEFLMRNLLIILLGIQCV